MTAALLLAPAAVAADVPGVHEQTTLEPAASWVAGKPVRVYCGNDAAGWQQAVTSVGITTDPLGFAMITEGGAYLAPAVCANLSPRSRTFGWALLTLIHESVHLSGVRNEWSADCSALSDVWGVAWTFFGVRQPMLAAVYRQALVAHLQSPPQYRRDGNC